MAIQSRARLDRQHIVQNIAFHPGRARQCNGVGFNLPDDFPMYEAFFRHHGAIYPARFANRQLCTVNIPGKDAIDLNFSVADDIPGDLHAGAQDRRRARCLFLVYVFIL